MATLDHIDQLKKSLEVAEKRCQAAVLTLRSKHEYNSAWEEFRAATTAKLVAERVLAEAQGTSYATPIDFPVRWCTGAPMPHLLQSDHQTFLIFYVRDRVPSITSEPHNVRQSENQTADKLAIVNFKGCESTRMGAPNDEAFEGHPLFGKGLDAYCALRIENSAWLQELEMTNSIHTCYSPEKWKNLSHYFFGFHDSIFECVATSFSVEEREAPLSLVLAEICEKL